VGADQADLFLHAGSQEELVGQLVGAHSLQQRVHQGQGHAVIERLAVDVIAAPLERRVPDHAVADLHTQGLDLGPAARTEIDPEVAPLQLRRLALALAQHVARKRGEDALNCAVPRHHQGWLARGQAVGAAHLGPIRPQALACAQEEKAFLGDMAHRKAGLVAVAQQEQLGACAADAGDQIAHRLDRHLEPAPLPALAQETVNALLAPHGTRDRAERLEDLVHDSFSFLGRRTTDDGRRTTGGRVCGYRLSAIGYRLSAIQRCRATKSSA